MAEIQHLVPVYQAVKVGTTREERVRDINALLDGTGWRYREAPDGYRYLDDTNSTRAYDRINDGDHILRDPFDGISVHKGDLPAGLKPYSPMVVPQPYPVPYSPYPYLPGGGWYTVS